MNMAWFVIVFIITHGIVAFFAYRWGMERGLDDGYGLGQADGFKAGQERGIQLGLKAGVKEHMLSSLVQSPPMPGIQADLQEQVRQELMSAINHANDVPKKVANDEDISWWATFWDNFAAWFMLFLFVILLALFLN